MPVAGRPPSPWPSGARSSRSRCPAPGSRAAVLDLEPGQAGRVPGRRGVVDDHQPRGPAAPAPRGRRVLSSDQDLEAVTRPGLRGQEEPHPAPVRADRRHRRRPGRRPEGSSAWTSSGRSTSSRTRAGSGRLGRRRAGATSPAPVDLYPPTRGAPPAGRRRPFPRPVVRAHQAPQAPRGVPGVPALSAHPLPAWVRLGIVLDNFSPDLSTAPTAGSPTGRRPATSSWPMCPPTLGG
jgi:hypothetical protein